MRLSWIWLLGCAAYGSETPEEEIAANALNEEMRMAAQEQRRLELELERAELESFEKKIEEASEHHEFQAEVSRLLDILINSLYTQKDVFLRELISNAADALEKVRFLMVSGKIPPEADDDMRITVESDIEESTVTITDHGIGMTRSDLINNLGTVAKSGTSTFLDLLASGGDVNLIGQFGVGFYSAFLVADKVTVVSKHENDDQYIWTSKADAKFSIAKDPRGNTMTRGTRITLHLRDDSLAFASDLRLRDTLKKFSQFVNFPIFLRTREVHKGDNDEDVVYYDWSMMNPDKPIWLKPKDEVTDQEHRDFYRSYQRSIRDPISWIHFYAEGDVDFRALLYFPEEPPLFDDRSDQAFSVKLYVRRVLVYEHFQELMPRWMRFVSGIVDSDELPLKVDRETLSHDRMMRVISKKIVRKSVDQFKRMLKETEDLESTEDLGVDEAKRLKTLHTFWEKYGAFFRIGCFEDETSREKIAQLLRYQSLKHNKVITLAQYIDEMPEDQTEIYYISGSSMSDITKSPHLEMFRQKGWDVLFLLDLLDEPCFTHLGSHKEIPLRSIEKGDLRLGEADPEDKKYMNQLEVLFEHFLMFWTGLGRRKDPGFLSVRISRRLTDSPYVIAAGDYGYTPMGEKLMRAQAGYAGDHMEQFTQYKSLEINPHHPIIARMKKMFDEDPGSATLETMSTVILNAALLRSGFDILEPEVVNEALLKYIASETGADLNTEVERYKVAVNLEEQILGQYSDLSPDFYEVEKPPEVAADPSRKEYTLEDIGQFMSVGQRMDEYKMYDDKLDEYYDDDEELEKQEL